MEMSSDATPFEPKHVVEVLAAQGIQANANGFLVFYPKSGRMISIKVPKSGTLDRWTVQRIGDLAGVPVWAFFAH